MGVLKAAFIIGSLSKLLIFLSFSGKETTEETVFLGLTIVSEFMDDSMVVISFVVIFFYLP